MGDIVLKQVIEQEHADGSLIGSCYCWEEFPENAAWVRRQRFQAVLDQGESASEFLCVRKVGTVLCASFQDGPLRLKQSVLVSVDEVMPLGAGLQTLPDYDYYCAHAACAALGLGKFSLSLCTSRFKSGAGEKYGKSDSDPPGFGAANRPRDWAGADYVEFKDLDISDPIGTHSGSYGFNYMPVHCKGYAGMTQNPWDRLRLLTVLLKVVRDGVSDRDWEAIRKFLDELGAPGFTGPRAPMESVLGGAGMRPLVRPGMGGELVETVPASGGPAGSTRVVTHGPSMPSGRGGGQ